MTVPVLLALILAADMMEYDKTKANLELFKDRHLNNRKRMCDAKFNCRGCEIYKAAVADGCDDPIFSCDDYCKTHSEKINAIAEKWCKENDQSPILDDDCVGFFAVITVLAATNGMIDLQKLEGNSVKAEKSDVDRLLEKHYARYKSQKGKIMK